MSYTFGMICALGRGRTNAVAFNTILPYVEDKFMNEFFEYISSIGNVAAINRLLLYNSKKLYVANSTCTDRMRETQVFRRKPATKLL